MLETQDPRDGPGREWRYFYGAWTVFIVGMGFVNATNIIMEQLRQQHAVSVWHPLVTEYTGVLSLLILIPLIKWFDEHFTFRRQGWKVPLFAHLGFTIPFTVIHTLLFTLERKLIFPLFGSQYELGSLGFEFLYEYRKIAVGYFLVVVSLYGFRHYLQLRRLLDLPEARREDVPSPPKHYLRRVLAQRNEREIIIDTRQIHYLEAAGNYVVLHTAEGQFKVRATLNAMEKQLDPEVFTRIHRSHMVNIDAIKEIQPWFRGDQRIILHDGTMLNLSRRYRDRFLSLANLMTPQEKTSPVS